MNLYEIRSSNKGRIGIIASDIADVVRAVRQLSRIPDMADIDITSISKVNEEFKWLIDARNPDAPTKF